MIGLQPAMLFKIRSNDSSAIDGCRRSVSSRAGDLKCITWFVGVAGDVLFSTSLSNDIERQAAGVTKSSRIRNAAEEPLSTSMSSTYRMASRRVGSRLSSSGLA